MRLDKYDRIWISDQTHLNRLLHWRDHNKDLVRKAPMVLSEGVIIFVNEETFCEFFRYEGSFVHFRTFVGKQWAFSFSFDRKTWRVFDIERSDWISSSLAEAMQDGLTVQQTLMAYMAYYENQTACVSPQRQTYTKNSGKTHQKKKHRVYLTRVQYEIKVPKELPVVEKQFERHTLSWRVRGHFRHYKNGKTIWVDSYIKGNKNQPPDTQDYQV